MRRSSIFRRRIIDVFIDHGDSKDVSQTSRGERPSSEDVPTMSCHRQLNSGDMLQTLSSKDLDSEYTYFTGVVLGFKRGVVDVVQ